MLLGASSVAHMMKAVCNREEGETAMYYMSRPGSTIDDMFKALKKAMDSKDFFRLDEHGDPEIKKANDDKPRPLMILVYMTLNDLNAILDAEYLTDTMEAFRQLTESFQKATGRLTRISFSLYMFAPSRREAHTRLSEMNAIIEKANKEIFLVSTYDPNTRLLRPVKTGRPGNVTLYKPDGSQENFHTDTSITGNWILPGAYHVSDKKLRQISKDIRVFFSLGMQEANARPWDAYDMDVQIELDEVLPKFNPNEEYPSLNSASLYATRAASGSQEKEKEDRAPGERTLGDFVEQARDREGEDQDRNGPKRTRTRKHEDREGDKRARRESQEDRRLQARQAARKRTKERLRGTTEDKSDKWQEIKTDAEGARPPTDTRVSIEFDVASMSMSSEDKDGME